MEDEKLEMLNGTNLNERKETDCSQIPFLQLGKMRYKRMFPFRWWESRSFSSDGEEFNFESAFPLLKAQHFVVVYTSFSGKEKGWNGLVKDVVCMHICVEENERRE